MTEDRYNQILDELEYRIKERETAIESIMSGGRGNYTRVRGELDAYQQSHDMLEGKLVYFRTLRKWVGDGS